MTHIRLPLERQRAPISEFAGERVVTTVVKHEYENAHELQRAIDDLQAQVNELQKPSVVEIDDVGFQKLADDRSSEYEALLQEHKEHISCQFEVILNHAKLLVEEQKEDLKPKLLALSQKADYALEESLQQLVAVREEFLMKSAMFEQKHQRFVLISTALYILMFAGICYLKVAG